METPARRSPHRALFPVGLLWLLLGLTSCEPATEPEPAREPSVSATYASVITLPRPQRIQAQFEQAPVVLVGRVTRVTSAFGLNEHGDRLILSQVRLAVESTVRGAPRGQVVLEVEGGAVGDLTLDVSDLPTLRPGDRGVFAVRRSRDDRSWVPWGRGRGILLVPPSTPAGALRTAVLEGR